MRLKPFSKAIDASTRDEILNVAQKVFAEVGFKEATVRQICKGAKANVCLISYYFGGKEGLYKAVILRVMESRLEKTKHFFEKLPQHMTAHDYRLRLQLLLESLHEEFTARADFSRIIQREMADGMPRVGDIVKEYVGIMRETFTEFISYGQKQKFIKKDLDPMLTTMSVINLFMSFSNQQSIHPEFYFKGMNAKEAYDQIQKTVLTIFFDGIMQ